MTLGELKALIDAELTRRPSSELSVVTIYQPCGDVGHFTEIVELHPGDMAGHTFTLEAERLHCCELLEGTGD